LLMLSLNLTVQASEVSIAVSISTLSFTSWVTSATHFTHL
jgi:hypothetical protein